MSVKGKSLVVESNPLIRKAYTIMLENLDYQVDVANNGEQALQLLARHCYKISLINIHLPDMSGITITKSLKERSPETKIIAVTRHLTDEIIKNCLEAGSDLVLSNPIRVEDLKKYATKETV